MIFAGDGHIEMIRNGLYQILTDSKGDPMTIVKTQTRRMKRSYYQIETERNYPHEIGYAVQRKRGAKGEPDIRIVMDNIWSERCMYPTHPEDIIQIFGLHAWAEGGYTPEQYEKVFRELNPKWDGQMRWVFEFHVVSIAESTNLKQKEVKTKKENAILRGYGVSEEEIADIEKVGRGEVKVEDYNRKWMK